MAESRQKTFHYKRAQIIGAKPQSLSGIILAAHKKDARPAKRSHRSGEGNKRVRVVNQCYARGQMVVGCLLDYNEGDHQTILTVGEDDLEYAISLLPLAERQQVMSGSLFFGVQENHVVVMQSQALRAAEFQAYLNWWLIQSAQVLEDGAFISLDNVASKAGKAILTGVKAVTLRASVTDDILPVAEQNPNFGGLTRDLKSRIFEMLRTEGTFDDTPDVDAATQIDDVDFSLEIRRRGRQKGKTSVMDGLARVLRDADESIFQIETKRGKVRGVDLWLTEQKSVKTINSVPELADVADKMQKWLDFLLESQQVSEDV
ncbi:MAG: Uncharacterized protein JWM41_248 [Gemmatimonadetes bacterium]|nr:Uncharacterized protein [Gemmatimonadota bacterium]